VRCTAGKQTRSTCAGRGVRAQEPGGRPVAQRRHVEHAARSGDASRDTIRRRLESGEGLTCGSAHARARGTARPGAGGGQESLGKGAHEHGGCGSD
jgi:hypothetical protein